MRKFLLVLFVGIVLAISLYGIVNDQVVEKTEEAAITVYIE